MTAREMYTKAYSTRRAVCSRRMEVSEWLNMWNETVQHTQVSEKAQQSFIRRDYKSVTKWDRKRQQLLKKQAN